MIINNNISQFIVYESEPIKHALEKINLNKHNIIFVTENSGKLTGSLSDGDFRRELLKNPNLNLEDPVEKIQNTNVFSQSSSTKNEIIRESFNETIKIIPLTDDIGRFVSVAMISSYEASIGEISIGENHPTFIIAEIGNNHNGSIDLAIELIDLAVEAGADCVKFQLRQMDDLYKSGDQIDESADLGAQYTLDLLSRFQLNNEEMIIALKHCIDRGVVPLCTPWDLESLKILEDFGLEVYKVASADFTNYELIEAIANTKKPMICSTGMTSEQEIIKTIEFLNSKGAQYFLLHCNSTYPAPFKDVNLKYINNLKEMSGGIVGYSGHERDINVCIAAVAMGANIIEKHFTVDRDMEGNDHKVSLLPDEFKKMVRAIRQIEEALGTSDERVLTQGEMINRETLSKSLITNSDLKKGDVIKRSMIEIKSPGQGLQPMYINDLVGKFAKRDFQINDYFYESDLKEETIEPRNYKFKNIFGIPVRFHDYHKLKELSNIDFVEFHLSYTDLDMNLEEVFQSKENIQLAVHSPELFAGDHILDLASDNYEYQTQSIKELNRVCLITREIKKFFPKTKKPVIVLNAGGFSKNAFADPAIKENLYNKVGESLSSIDDKGVEIIIQTMPPFPWHFGGQRFHNLFVDPDEIVKFCTKYNRRICLDVSHSKMSCNFYNWDLKEFIEKVSPYIAHLHIVDAKGNDGEGIQIGRGDVDFVELSEVLSKNLDKYQFIPEVWQGHKNSGEGFWHALEFLEKNGF
tara:strand:+ start:1705 stop:3951 length:2247 start_codon:yes stop_codon:yes gene_type:complete